MPLIPAPRGAPARARAAIGLLAAALIWTVAAPGCGDTEAPGSLPASLVVTPTSLSLAPGQSEALSVSVLDGQGRLLTGVPVEFASADMSVATVTPTGLVTAAAVVPDTTTVTIRVPPSGPFRIVTVEVMPVFGGVEISPKSARLGPGATAQFTARVYDSTGTTVPGMQVAFLGRDTRLLTVSTHGLATATNAWGTTYVVAFFRGFSDSALVSVTPIVASPLLSDGPFGVAVAPSGLVYITREYADRLGVMALPDHSVALGPTVGAVATDVIFDAAGTTAYVTNQLSHNVGVIDVASGTQVRTIEIGTDPWAIAIEPGGQRLWVTDNGSEVVVIDLGSETVAARIPVGWAANGIAFHPSQPIAYVSSVGAGTVSKISTTTLAVIKTVTLGGALQGLAVAPDGSELYIADEAGAKVSILDLATDAVIGSIPLGAGAFDAHLTPDAAHLLVGLPSAGEVVVIDRVARTVSGRIRTEGLPRRIGCEPDGSVCVVANEFGWVDVFAW